MELLAAVNIPVRERLRSPALLIVDMQNDFVRLGAPMEVADARQTIAPIRSLIGAFRRRDRPILFTRFLTRTKPDLMWLWSPQCWPDTRCCWAGHRRQYVDVDEPLPCADIVDELAPETGDVVIDKFGYGAFHETDLHDRLGSLGVQSLLVVGTVTQICVEETAREAFHHGYRTTIAADAVSSFAPDLHAAALKNFAMKFGWVTDSETALSWL